MIDKPRQEDFHNPFEYWAALDKFEEIQRRQDIIRLHPPDQYISSLKAILLDQNQPTAKKMATYVGELSKNGHMITPEMLANPGNFLKDLDPSSIFIMRAIAGRELFTPEALGEIRKNWCEYDLPPGLFGTIGLSDEQFLTKVHAFRFARGETVLIEGLTKTGALRDLVNRGPSIRQKWPMVNHTPTRSTPLNLQFFK